MRVLIAHNHYQHRGGEDAVVEAERSLLEGQGCQVETLTRHNDHISGMSPVAAAMNTLWSFSSAKGVIEIIKKFSPDVIHVHNTFPLLSPSIFWAAQSSGVPIVLTLHNFRLLCPQAMFLRNGRICEDCVGAEPWRGVRHGCYRGSRPHTAVLAGMLSLHRAMGTWQQKVTRYVALNRFCREKFIEGGLPAERIAIKPNFIDAPKPEGHRRTGGLFVGRLSSEKGITTLLDALTRLNSPLIEFVGKGPEQDKVIDHPQARYLGGKNQEEVIGKMQKASYLVVPSIWYENFPRTIVEAFACGLPVIASALGGMPEIVTDCVTGLLFEPNNPDDLAEKIKWAEDHPDRMLEMGQRARREYEMKYTPQINYAQLMAIYEEAIAEKKGDVQ